jgi:hypothetical protein
VVITCCGLTWLLKDLWTRPRAALRTTAYRRTQYVFFRGLMMPATTSISLSWGMASYAPVTSACGTHVSTTERGPLVLGARVLLALPPPLGSNLTLESCRACRLGRPVALSTAPPVPLWESDRSVPPSLNLTTPEGQA